MNKILVLGQTPPPFGGQAVMIQKLIEGDYKGIKLYHIRMSFSKEMSDMGKLQIGKLIHLFSTVLNVFYHRLFFGTKVLYYPPSGPDKIAVYRDMIILFSTRWMFRSTIFHFHAGGISELWGKLNKIERWIFKRSFFKNEVSILLSSVLKEDADFLQSKKSFVVPYGLEDHYDPSLRIQKVSDRPRILFIGVLRETKGEFVLLEAAKILAERNHEFEIEFVGKFYAEEIETRFFDYVNKNNLDGKVFYKGEVTGKEKDRILANSDIFCFPTFFESETFGLVLVEAMQFNLPLVGTKWRGVPDNINDGENGFLVEIKNPTQVADCLEKLIADDELRLKMGQASRKYYERKYTLEKYHQNIEKCFLTALND